MPKSGYITVLLAIFVVSCGSLSSSDRPISESNDRLYRRHQPYRTGGPSNVDHRHDRYTSFTDEGTAERHLNPLEVRVHRNRHPKTRDQIPKFYSASRLRTGVGSDKHTGNMRDFNSNVSGTGSRSTHSSGSRRYHSRKSNDRNRKTGKITGSNSRVREEERSFNGKSLESHPKLNEWSNSRTTNGDSEESPMGLTKLDEMLQRLENNNEQLLQQMRRERDNIAVSRLGHHGRHGSHRHTQRRPLQLHDDIYRRALSPQSSRDGQTAYDPLLSTENLLSADNRNRNRVSPEHHLYGHRTYQGGRFENGDSRSELMAPLGQDSTRLDDFAPRLDLEGASSNGIDLASEDEATMVEDADYQDEEAMIKSRKTSPRVHQQTLVDPDCE
ncbi:hypothetical protein FHG87_015012 [Trinorchestia longiramus]|nr:hypothetical protein FHG87_015012 [Trinorchestia longiramus]